MRNIYPLALGCACLVAAAGCASEQQASPVPETIGSLTLGLMVEGLLVESVDLRIASEDLDPTVVRERTIDVSDPNNTVNATEAGLPTGTYGVALSAQVVDDPTTDFDESTIACAGEATGVAIAPGAITHVEGLVLVCTRDGGELQTAGGLSLQASVAYEEINQCGDLVKELSVAPLATRVGASVDLLVVAAEGVTVEWTAAHGTIATDGTSYTCPEIAGTYDVELTATGPNGCTDVLTQAIACHGTYTGECGVLPSAFAFEGSCGLRSPCHLVQDGCSWEAECRGRTIRGEADGESSFPFIDTATSDLACTASLVDGELVGTCTDATGETCTVATNTDPAPSAACATLGDTVSDLTACGSDLTECDVIRDGCRYQAKCEDGTVRNGQVVGEELQWNIDERASGGNYYRCQEPIVDGQVAGSCERRRGELAPEICEDFSATVALIDHGTCHETLPTGGFKLSGCGFEDVCFARQRGCVWEVFCDSGTFAGVATTSNSFEFDNAAGQACTASVVNGEVQGTCEGAGESCAFSEVVPAVDETCFQIPTLVESNGCGGRQVCQVLQDGCTWAALCTAGTLAGTVDEDSLTWPGLNPDYVCHATLTEAGDQMNGNCTRDNPDGTVSECRDLTDVQDDRLVLTFPSAE